MKQPLHILLCSPRGFCAGVDRAIAMVETAILKFGAPVYVRHEIVHNRTVVERLRELGAVFVEQLADIPDTSRPVIFSAHGVSKAVVAEAAERGFTVVDATCPLVSKVHHQAEMMFEQGHHIIMIGHAGHQEVLGTLGQIPAEAGTLVQTLADAGAVQPPARPLALVTQTTLSVDETQGIIAVLQARFPDIKLPKKDDICYATTNRQAAIKSIAGRCDALVVMGAPNSSNSRQLVEVARQQGCGRAILIQTPEELAAVDLSGVVTLGLSAGASAPEALVQGVIEVLRQTHEVTVEEVVTAVENLTFKMPQGLTQMEPVREPMAA